MQFKAQHLFSRIIPLLEWWSIYSLRWSCWRDAPTLQVNRGLHLLYNSMEIDWDIFCLAKLLWEKHNNTYEVFSALSVFICLSQQQLLALSSMQEFHSILGYSFCTNKSQAKAFPNTQSITYPPHLLLTSYTPVLTICYLKYQRSQLDNLLEGTITWQRTIQQSGHLSLSILDLDFILNCLFSCLGCT